jgi:hypothetical protein
VHRYEEIRYNSSNGSIARDNISGLKDEREYEI